MADDNQRGRYSQEGEEAPGYTEEELASFGIWVELGAKDPDQQRFLDVGLSITWERRDPSGSDWVFELLRNPIPVLMREKVPGIHGGSRLRTTILHHHRGLESKIIRTAVTVEQQTGDGEIEVDKETRVKDEQTEAREDSA